MRALPTGRKKNAHRLRTRALWLCLLAGLFAIAMAMRPEVRGVLAQASTPPAASSQESTSPAQDAAAAVPAAKQDAQAPAAGGAPRSRIADDSANMLKLASRLKVEVDNTTADTLSITAIRDVQAIERLAHKMRTQ